MKKNVKLVWAAVALAAAIFCLLISGCTNPPKETTEFFEIILDKENYFHEIIILSSGEVFEKKGPANLSQKNQVKTTQIDVASAKNFVQKAKDLAKKGTYCEYDGKEIIVFDTVKIEKKCFGNEKDFDNLFVELTQAINNNAQENFFIHIINNNKTKSFDYHLHSNGSLITTIYSYNQLESARINKISEENIAAIKSNLTQDTTKQENLCAPFESGFNYAEIQQGENYNYYYVCEKNGQDKINFYNNALTLLGGS